MRKDKLIGTEGFSRRFMLTSGSFLAGAGLPGGGAAVAKAQLASGTAPLVFRVADFGAVPDGRTMNTAAFERALKACSAAGGGIVYVGPGEYLTGPIQLPSATALYLAPGAVVKGSPRLEDYPVEPKRISGESDRAGLVTARDATNVAILGSGILDGNSVPFHQTEKIKGGRDWDSRFTRQKGEFMSPKYGTETGPWDHGPRPGNLVRFINCRKALLSGVTIQNSPTWTIQFHGCEDVYVDGLNINSLGSGRRVPNDDGIDLRESRDIRISDCNIQTGDDCIAVFGSRNVTVANCTLASRSAGIRVGYAAGDIRNCTFQNLVIDSNCGLKVNVRSNGSVEDVLFSNIILRTGLITGHWWGKGEPVNVSAVPMRSGTELGRIRRVRFHNILAESENAFLIYGSPESVIEDILVADCKLHLRNSKLQPSYGGNFDLRGAADLSKALFEHDIPGLFFRHVRGLRVRGFQLSWDDSLPEFFSHGIEGEEFEDVVLQGFEGRQARSGARAAIALRSGKGISIRDCVAQQGCGTFLSMDQVSGQRLFVNNDLTLAQRAFDPATHGFTLSGNRMPEGGQGESGS